MANKNFMLALACVLAFFPGNGRCASDEELETTKAAIAQARAHQEKLAEEQKSLEAELRALQTTLVASAERIQAQEVEMATAEDKLRILSEQLDDKTRQLAQQKKLLASMVEAALRLSRTPPEAALMLPGDAYATARAARVLALTSQGIRDQAASIRLQMKELQKLKHKVEDHRAGLSDKHDQLENEQQALQKKLDQRQQLQKKLMLEEKEDSEKLALLAKKAGDLGDLMKSVDKSEKEKTAREVKHKMELEADERAPEGTKGRLRSFEDAKGSIRPPLAGRVVQNFGMASRRNETTKGITIAARPGAAVTAPFDAEVVFTGPFLNYGRLVILRHSDDYHTLLAGLATIEVTQGQFLLEGEPIGAMGEGRSSSRLYLELRKNNQPIDPSHWIAGLAKKP